MRILKLLFGALIVLLVLGAVFAALNWEKVKRLGAVNSLFSEEKIVFNFSNMDSAFPTVPIQSSGDVEVFETNAKDLPTVFSGEFGEKNVVDWLEERKTTSLVVLHDGEITFEDYYLGTKPDDLRISWSMAKSFLSIAFGVAVNEGLIELEKPVDSYVPELATSAYAGVSVLNVLNMSSGVAFNEDYLDFWSDINKMGRLLAIGGSMDAFTVDINERALEPGEARKYVSIDTHVLAMVLRAVTKESLPSYLAEHVISPIGFEKQPYYVSDSEGVAFALGGLNVTSRDYARIGQMILDNGKWAGEQIVPAGWVVASTIESAKRPKVSDGFGYGYQWWIPDGSVENGGDFMARGIYGQYIYINPRAKTVIVQTAADRKFREKRADGTSIHQVNLDMFRAIANHQSKLN